MLAKESDIVTKPFGVVCQSRVWWSVLKIVSSVFLKAYSFLNNGSNQERAVVDITRFFFQRLLFSLFMSSWYKAFTTSFFQVLPLTQFCHLCFFVKKYWFAWEGKSMTPNIGEDIVLFRSLQQLLSLPLDPLNGFLIWLDALQGHSTLPWRQP